MNGRTVTDTRGSNGKCFLEHSEQHPENWLVFDPSRQAAFVGPLTECRAWIAGYEKGRSE